MCVCVGGLSLCLSRDVWKNEMIQDILDTRFALWLYNDTSPDGQRFCHVYKVDMTKLPAVYILDPRYDGPHSVTPVTGEIFLFHLWLSLSQRVTISGYLYHKESPKYPFQHIFYGFPH